MSKPTKSAAPAAKRRKNPRGGAYWSLFALCAMLSFGAGFWYTYQMTSQVSIKDPGANEVPMATPLPNQAMVTPGPDIPEEEALGMPAAMTEAPLDQAPAPSAPKTSPTPPPAPRAETPRAEAVGQGIYRVQVGSYSSREEAQAMVEELAVAGIDAMVVEDESKFHAQIGAYGSRERALSVADEVNTKGYSVTIRH